MSIYQEVLLEHHRNPRNKGRIKNPTKTVSLYNPLCGDKLEMDISIKDGKIEDIKFEGHGCVISQASASILTAYVFGKKVNELRKINKDFMIKLVGIQVGPTRLKCLLLSLEALKKLLISNS